MRNIANAEKWYIRKRRLLAFANSLCFYLCRLFPIKRNRIVVCTFEGKGGFCCNPKYVIQELHKLKSGMEIIWLVDDMSREFPDYIMKVPNTTWSRAYWMSTAKVWIDNYRTRYGTKKRKGQYYLNTNHYTIGLKTVGLWRGEGFSTMAALVSRTDSEMIDGLITDSDFCLEMCPRGLLYQGELLNIGAPRLDVLYGDRTIYRENFRNRHGLSKNTKVVMFAPTFREHSVNGVRSVYSEEWTIDFVGLVQTLTEKFGGEWNICLRVHPQLAKSFSARSTRIASVKVIDESLADDMYEILPAMDAYITDYSSACFDACYAEIPVFLYADDIDSYKEARGTFFWEMSSEQLSNNTLNSVIFQHTKAELPFSISTDNEMLKENIRTFDEKAYVQRIKKFKQDLNIIFDGKASMRAVRRIMNRIGAD